VNHVWDVLAGAAFLLALLAFVATVRNQHRHFELLEKVSNELEILQQRCELLEQSHEHPKIVILETRQRELDSWPLLKSNKKSARPEVRNIKPKNREE